MPVKNEGLYFEECLKSIVAQSEKNWELLVCDDHSEDNTKEIIFNFCSKHPKIKYFTNQGKGIIPALITAYDKSKGEIITRMDGDDVMPPQKLSSLRTILALNGKGTVATGKVKYFPEEQIADGFYTYQNWLNNLCVNKIHWEEIYKECVIPSPCWMIYKEDFDACGGFKNSTYPEDYDLVFRMYQNKLKVNASKETLHLWRDHPLRTSRNSTHYQTQTFFELKLKYLFEIEKLNAKNLVVWGAGKKGKILSSHLRERNKEHRWVCNNPNKIGHFIERIKLEDYNAISNIKNACVIITVSGHEDRSEIITFLESNGLVKNESYFLFC